MRSGKKSDNMLEIEFPHFLSKIIDDLQCMKKKLEDGYNLVVSYMEDVEDDSDMASGLILINSGISLQDSLLKFIRSQQQLLSTVKQPFSSHEQLFSTVKQPSSPEQLLFSTVNQPLSPQSHQVSADNLLQPENDPEILFESKLCKEELKEEITIKLEAAEETIEGTEIFDTVHIDNPDEENDQNFVDKKGERISKENKELLDENPANCEENLENGEENLDCYKEVKDQTVIEATDIVSEKIESTNIASHEIEISQNGVKEHICKECGKTLKTPATLEKHIFRMHHSSRPYKCEECPSSFAYIYDLREHSNRGHEGKRKREAKLKCDQCRKSFTALWNLNRHKKEVHCVDGKIKCKTCHIVFSREEGLEKHTSKFHPQRRRSIEVADGDKGKTQVCEICGKSFHKKEGLKNHLLVHSDAKPFKCDQCPKECKTERYLKMHIQNAHTAAPKEDQFECEHCRKEYPNLHKLKVHGYNCSKKDDKPFSCDVCQVKFVTRYSLKKHIMRVHLGEKPHKCEQCGKSFSEVAKLNKHMKLHSGEKPFQCNVCSKAFPFKKYLENHYRVHTGEKPFVCKFCSKAFSLESDMYKHIRKFHK